MSKKPQPRIGSDPLRWIKDTASPEKEPTEIAPDEEEGVVGTVPKTEAPEPVAVAPDTGKGKLGKSGKSSKPSKLSNHGNPGNTSLAGLTEEWTRATLIARIDHMEKIKALAYLDRKPLKDVYDEAFSGYLKSRAGDLKEAEPLYKRRRVT